VVCTSHTAAQHQQKLAAASLGANPGTTTYRRRQPEHTALHRVLKQHWPTFLERAEEAGGLPDFVKREIEGYLSCGLLEHGFARMRCGQRGFEHLVAFSCKGRAVCPSCTGRRMNDTAAHLVDRVLPLAPIRQWVCSFSHAAGCVAGGHPYRRARAPGVARPRKAGRQARTDCGPPFTRFGAFLARPTSTPSLNNTPTETTSPLKRPVRRATTIGDHTRSRSRSRQGWCNRTSLAVEQRCAGGTIVIGRERPEGID
jgi:hypothetical protein